MNYRVMRQHFGDRMYMPGDDREAEPADVAHLVKAGILNEHPGGDKPGKAAPKRKALGAAPENKAS